MSHKINLTTDGYSGQCGHSSPTFYGKISVSATTSSIKLSMSLTTNGESTSGSFFNYDVGFTVNGKLCGSGRWNWSGAGNHTYTLCSNYDISNESFPITVVFVCQGCDHAGGNSHLVEFDTGDSEFIFYDNRHTHNNTTPTCSIESTSGTTITVKGSGTGSKAVREGSGTWYGQPHTFTGYSQGSSHNFYARTRCNASGCPESDKNEKISSKVTGKTWNITCSVVEQGYTTMTFGGKQTAGTGGSNTNSINYKVYKGDGTLFKSGTITSGNNLDSNGNYRIGVTGLEPKTSYYCEVESAGITNASGVCDNTAASNKSSTYDPTPVTPSTGGDDVSATTLKVDIDFGGPDGADVSCTVTCSGGGSITTSTPGCFVFTGLTPGITYTVSYVVTITVTSTITDAKGNKKKVTNTYQQSGTACTQTTYKASFGSIDVTSKIIEFSSHCNKSASMEQKLGYGSWEITSSKIYNNLTHNTSYSIYARVYGCYAFNSDGSTSSWNDSEISTTVSTLLLSLSGSISEEHQHRIVTLWQAYVGGSARDSDAIDGTSFEFTYKATIAKKVYPYQRSEVTEGSVDPTNGKTSGTYQSDKKIYSENLKWYYCEYVIEANITDGYNVVGASVIAHTTFPHAWIYSGGRWHKAMGHVYTNGAFVPAPCFVDKGSSFREPNGE